MEISNKFHEKQLISKFWGFLTQIIFQQQQKHDKNKIADDFHKNNTVKK